MPTETSKFHRCHSYPITYGHNLLSSTKKGVRLCSLTPLFLVVPRTRIELVQPQGPRDFKSLASTNSATQAFFPTSCKKQMHYIGAFYR